MKISGLDHVAVKVKAPDASARRYEQTLGLSRFSDDENWDPYPILVLGGESNVEYCGNTNGDGYTYNTGSLYIKISQ